MTTKEAFDQTMDNITAILKIIGNQQKDIKEQKEHIEKLELGQKVLIDRIKILEKALNKPT